MSMETLLPAGEDMGLLPFEPIDDFGTTTPAIEITASDIARMAIDLTDEELAKFVSDPSVQMAYTTTRTGQYADDADPDN